jgi:molybdopterin adenylyltransferase
VEKAESLIMIQFNNSEGRITAISISNKKGIPKTNINTANLIENWGIEGDAHAGNWHRQVSLLALESIVEMRKKGMPNLLPGDFAENITTSFVKLPTLPIGTIIRIGKTELEVTQIGKECHSRCAIFQNIGDCVMPRDGIFAKVIKGGVININEKVEVIRDLC